MRKYLRSALDSGSRIRVFTRKDEGCFFGTVESLDESSVLIRCYSEENDEDSWGDTALCLSDIYRVTVRHIDDDRNLLERTFCGG